MLQRIYAIFLARNLEFMRDRGTLAWNILLPVLLMAGLATALGGDGRTLYTVGVVESGGTLNNDAHPFLETDYIDFVVFDSVDSAMPKIARHQIDLLIDVSSSKRYWVNPSSPKGYFVELALLQADSTAGGTLEKSEITGDAINYVDWVLPGILGMNMMFSCLFGVGYVVVRYRKNGFLKRLRATPVRPIEFIIAQVASRLLLTLTITSIIFVVMHLVLDTRMDGSFLTLLLVGFVGSVALVSMGLLVAARVTSEELAGGLLNMINWPMMLLSGVWFSLEGAGDLVQSIANIFPLTHILDAARGVILDGHGLVDIWPSLAILVAMSLVFMGVGARFFRWDPA
ncbi:MAG: ABC transporter permease [Pseudomonadota bacterium]